MNELHAAAQEHNFGSRKMEKSTLLLTKQKQKTLLPNIRWKVKPI
jgi:hypothetical protein